MRKKIIIAFVIVGGVLFLLTRIPRINPQVSQATPSPMSNKDERNAFVDSVIALNKARDLSNQGLPLPKKLPQDVENEIFSLTEEGINLSKKVGDEFLDSLHPELRTMYKDNLIKGSELWLEGAKNSNSREGVEKQLSGNELVTEWINWFEKNGKMFEDKIF